MAIGAGKWPVVYFLVFIGFAWWYARLIPRGFSANFYTSTAQYEPGAQAGLQLLRQDIETAALGQMSQGGTWSARSEPRSQDGEITDLQVTPQAISFRYTASRMLHRIGHQDLSAGVVIPLARPAQPHSGGANASAYWRAQVTSARSVEWRDGRPTSHELPPNAPDWLPRRPVGATEGTGWLQLRGETSRALEQYRQTGGVSSRPIDVFWRALYLSAATITTLGYGDIVPVSTVARLSVGLEAFGGVCLVGLFVNALARRTRRLAEEA